jgi:methionyl-tRNA formyltransferase
MAQKAAELLPPLLEKIREGRAKAITQNHSEASYCSLATSEDGLINWNKSAAETEARIRAFNPWPLCWTLHGGIRLFILKADAMEAAAGTPGMVLGIDKKLGILIQTGEGILAVKELQYQARKALGWKDFMNGARDFTGSLLG